MISFHNIKVVFKKEFLHIMRDKSVLFTNFFIPLFGIPLYIILVFEGASYKIAKLKKPLEDNTIFSVSYQGDIVPSLEKELTNNKKIKLIKEPISLEESEITQYRVKYKNFLEAKQRISRIKERIQEDKETLKKNNSILSQAKKDYLLSLQNISQKFKGDTDLHIAVFKNRSEVLATYFFHSEKNPTSTAALRYVKNIFQRHENKLINDFKLKKNIKHHNLDPFYFWDVNLDRATNSLVQVIGLGIGGGLLFLILISVFNPTINTTLGERDQNTFKVLLMNPISMQEIFIGKYLNVAFQGLIAIIPYGIESIIFYAWSNSNFLYQMLPEISFLTIIFLLLATIFAAISISALCFSVCSFTRTRSQAQALITLLMFVIFIPMIAIGLVDLKLNLITAFIPIINFPLATESLMMPTPHYLAIFLSFIVNFVLSIALILFSQGSFIVQWKGSSETKGLSDLLNIKRRKTKKLNPAHAFLAFAIAFLGYTYGSLILTTLKVELFNYLFAPILFSLGTAIFITQYSGLDFTRTFKWRGIDWKYLIRLTIAAITLSFMFNALFRNSVAAEMFKIDFPKIFESSQFATYLSYFFLFAVIPGFCEEVLFRGIIFKSLRSQYNMSISTIVSSIMFAILHFSMFRWGHTFIIAIFLAIMYERRGLISCILFHILFNAASLFLGFADPLLNWASELPTIIKFSLFPVMLSIVWVLLIYKAESSKNKVEEWAEKCLQTK